VSADNMVTNSHNIYMSVGSESVKSIHIEYSVK